MTPFELLELYLANDHEPKLSPEALDALLLAARVTDTNGLAPDDAGWIATYDVHRAAAAGWRAKAARVAADYTIAAGGTVLNRAEMGAAFLKLAREHARLSRTQSIKLGAYVSYPGDFAELSPWLV